MFSSTDLQNTSSARTTKWRRLRTALLSVVGVLAAIWYLLRVLPKPSRRTYPCVQAAAPLAAGTFAYLGGAGVVAFLLRKAVRLKSAARYGVASAAILAAGLVAWFGVAASADRALAIDVATFRPSDAPNTPIGVAKGIKAGRVAWAMDPSAVKFTGAGRFDQDANTDKVKVRAMLEKVITVTADNPDIAAAWDALFRHFNSVHHGAAAPYVAGEKIAIKANLNNNGNGTAIDESPQLVHAMLWELVNVLKVAQADISIYDTARRAGMGAVKTSCQGDFPNVHYNDGGLVRAAFRFSGGGLGTANIGSEIDAAKYQINMAILKRHGRPVANWNEGGDGLAGVTLTFKNQCGSMDVCAPLHTNMYDWNKPFGSYNPLLDIMASEKVGAKNVLFLLDGLYTSDLHNHGPMKWNLAPFSGRYPASVFVSQDPVALDSVGLDFLRAEWPQMANADNYLHEAALIGSPPSKTVYKPDGTPVTGSLGVHEHWDGSATKQYSRNLDPANGKGIELVIAETYKFGNGSGTGGSSGAAGNAGTAGATSGGASGSSGAAGSAGGVTGSSGGAAGSSAGTAGAGGVTAVGGTSGGGAGSGGQTASTTNSAGQGGSATSTPTVTQGNGQGGGCSIGGSYSAATALSAFVAIVALAARRRRRAGGKR